MSLQIWKRNIAAIAILGALSLALAGCGQSSGEGAKLTETATTNTAVDDHGWWCSEHGVPEESCAQCSAKIAADFQKKGDWCKEHNRPESQCFICHPEFETKFIAQYEAKFGQKPPKRTE